MNDELEYIDEDFIDDDYFDECGFSYEHGCQLAATEFCDWECSFHAEYVLWTRINDLNS